MLEGVELSVGLSAAQLDAIADLERRVLAADGGRLKLEWGELSARPGGEVNDALWWGADGLLGFTGIYVFGGGQPEITGMVDPSARRQGIGAGLFDAIARVCRARAMGNGLLLVPRSSGPGRQFALDRGGTLDHSEHALVLKDAPVGEGSDPRITLRQATVTDVETIGAILEAAFGRRPDDLREQIDRNSPSERTLLVELGGSPVGAVRLAHEVSAGTDTGGIYGFAVHPDAQGRGVGADVLRRCCRLLRHEGAGRVGLEVAVENDRALGLYLRSGFEPVGTEDYYAIRME